MLWGIRAFRQSFMDVSSYRIDEKQKWIILLSYYWKNNTFNKKLSKSAELTWNSAPTQQWHLFYKNLGDKWHLFRKNFDFENDDTNRQHGWKIIAKNLENPYNTRILTIFKLASFLSTRLKCSGLKRCRSKNPRFSRVFFVFRRFPHSFKIRLKAKIKGSS